MTNHEIDALMNGDYNEKYVLMVINHEIDGFMELVYEWNYS
jgi:hypothetical protein